MKVAVFGGSGRTGRHVVAQALTAGYEIIALARTPSKLEQEHERLTVVQGDIREAQKVERVVQDVDAVISVLAPTSNKPEFAVSKGIDNILSAMQKHNVQRLVASAGAGVRMPKDKPGIIARLISVLLHLFSKNIVADMEQAVEKITQSDRDWVVVRAPVLTDQPGTGHVVAGYIGRGPRMRLSREDFAAFILDQVVSDDWLREAPAVSN